MCDKLKITHKEDVAILKCSVWSTYIVHSLDGSKAIDTYTMPKDHYEPVGSNYILGFSLVNRINDVEGCLRYIPIEIEG